MRVAVLGGGVTGLTAAWRLILAGHAVRVFEASGRMGGFVRTEAADGWLFEAGPNSFLETSPETSSLIADLGLASHRIESDPAAANRYVVMGGKLVAFPRPSDVSALVSTPLFSMRSKLRITAEAAQGPIARDTDVSIADLVRDHFGSEVLERVVQPLVGGIYAGDAERLSARHAFPKIWEAERTVGSLVRAGMNSARDRRALGLPSAAQAVSFRHGLQVLPDALAARLPFEAQLLGTKVRSVLSGRQAPWRVGWDTPRGMQYDDFDRVVAAVPAWALAELEIGEIGRQTLQQLALVEHPPVAVVFAGYRRQDVQHPLDGFGALVPAAEGRSILGVIFSSSLFPGRAPEGHVALTAIAGGALQPEIARLPEAELARRVCSDLDELLGARGKPVHLKVSSWPRSIPQYNLGYGSHLEALDRCERENPGLYFGGIARNGIGLPDAIASGAALAKRVS